ncbi:EAL domain-containing protein, partial [uncultured Dechloromonas sp.]|uniref:putative bifunctional diguanylate cyclase/phosphodiesterase n=1 Tax=uncultured Dechloromonas sp. TaxID=171719 RepID=UPI0025CBC853
HFYDESLGIKASQRLSMEQKIRLAFDESQFEVHYQPIVDSEKDTRISGFEALLRWIQPGGAVSPAEFIPLAEETGLIVPLGEWVLRQACRQMKSWHELYPRGKGWSISVNVSVRQLHAGDFAERVAAALAESGLPAGALVLELTESLYADIERHATIPATLRRLREMGVRLAMDDFGTGYSALASLSRLPLDRLKIDRSFVNNITHAPEELAIARTIIAIGRQLGLEIVAEGVETAEQAALLNESGCHILQGWLFGKSLKPAAIEKALKENGFPASAG